MSFCVCRDLLYFPLSRCVLILPRMARVLSGFQPQEGRALLAPQREDGPCTVTIPH